MGVSAGARVLSTGIAGRIEEALDALARSASWARELPAVAAWLLVIAGLVALTAATRNRRALGAGGAATIGALAGLALRGPLAAHLGLAPVTAAALGAAALGLAGGFFPLAFPFAAGLLPAALLGVQVPLAGRAELGAAAAGLIGGILGLVFARPVAASFAALAGGVALALGLLGAFAGQPLAAELARRPVAVLAFAVVTGIAGAAFQLGGVRTPADPAARSPGSPT